VSEVKGCAESQAYEFIKDLAKKGVIYEKKKGVWGLVK